MKLDYCFHTHTYRCGHAIGKDEEYVKSAIDAGIKVLGFSDHVILNRISQPGIRGEFFELQDYIDSVNILKEKYKDQIEIHLGFECEHLPYFLPYYKELKEKYGIEYFICGQHFCLDKNGNFASYDKETRTEYINDIIDAMKSQQYNYIAHPDLIFRGRLVFDEKCIEQAIVICEASLKYDVPLEININGMFAKPRKKDEPFYYPIEEFWKVVGEYGCKVVIGVDAHNPWLFTHDKPLLKVAFSWIKKYNLNYIQDFHI